MKESVTWALLGVNGITGEMGRESGHHQLLFRQTVHLLFVRVNNPFSGQVCAQVCCPVFRQPCARLAVAKRRCYRLGNSSYREPAMIRHTVVFKLKHAAGSAEEKSFLQTAKILAAIPGVERFEQLRQTSQKNEFDFGFSMEFADYESYAAYNDHPTHVAFVRDRWVPEVAAFMETDYEPLV
jgi:hypothetical protein